MFLQKDFLFVNNLKFLPLDTSIVSAKSFSQVYAVGASGHSVTDIATSNEQNNVSQKLNDM